MTIEQTRWLLLICWIIAGLGWVFFARPILDLYIEAGPFMISTELMRRRYEDDTISYVSMSLKAFSWRSTFRLYDRLKH